MAGVFPGKRFFMPHREFNMYDAPNDTDKCISYIHRARRLLNLYRLCRRRDVFIGPEDSFLYIHGGWKDPLHTWGYEFVFN